MAAILSDVVPETEAATFIGMSVAFLRSGRVRGTIGNRTPAPPFLKIGRSVRYSKTDLVAWLAERRRPVVERVKPKRALAAMEGTPT